LYYTIQLDFSPSTTANRHTSVEFTQSTKMMNLTTQCLKQNLSSIEVELGPSRQTDDSRIEWQPMFRCRSALPFRGSKTTL